MNKLVDAYDSYRRKLKRDARKIDRADKIKDRVMEQSARLGAKSGTAKNQKVWQKAQDKIADKRKSAYIKIKDIKNKVGTLSKESEDYLKTFEVDKKIKQEDLMNQKMPTAKPTIPNFYGQ